MHKRDKRKCFTPVLSMGIFLMITISLTACTFWAVCIFSSANASFCPYEQKTIMISQSYVGMALPRVWEKEILKREEEAARKRAYLYIICNMREYLADPHGDKENPCGYIQEVGRAGDTITTAVFTFADGQVEKLVDVKNPKEAYIYFGVPMPKEAEESLRLVYEASGWVLKFPSGEEAALDSGFDYDFIR